MKKKMNKQSIINIDILKFRHQAKRAIRSMFDRESFIELDTPYLLPANTPDPFIDPLFVTSAVAKSKNLQLHTSPEIWLKKGVALGFKKIYQMARVFRDDPPGEHHLQEFTMLEWYRAKADLDNLIVDCESIFALTEQAAVRCNIINKPNQLAFLKTDLSQLFKELADLDLGLILDKIAKGKPYYLQEELRCKGEYLPTGATFFDAFFHVMLKYIEPNLPADRVVVISRWPVQLAALAAPCADDANFCERFEIYYRGLEIANAYQECTDPSIIRQRFITENSIRFGLGKPVFAICEDFLQSISKMPKTAGIALGIDRLLMAIARKHKISDINFGQI
jgi:elongation factor P--(R)-beta-lysine ligase